MKLIYFSIDYCPHDYRFLSALSETEYKIFYVRLQRGVRQTEDRPVPENIEIVQWAGGQKPFEWRDLPRLTLDFRRLTRQIKPDLIHAGPIQTCAFIAVLTGFRPILSMSWGFDLMKDVYRGRWWEFATRYTLKRSTWFTSDALVTRDKAVEYGMNPEKTVVFPWGVDLNHFKPGGDDGRWTTDDTSRPDGVPPSIVHRPSSGFTIFCNRSWEPNYGVDVLARAFAKVAQQRPEVSLILLGSGSQAQVIRHILMSGGVDERVTFPGHIPNQELPRYYHMADLYISPSHVDGSSVSLMEALACGLPCLVSDIPANKEWVRDDYNGWLFPDGDHNALAAQILKAMDGRKELPAIGKNARATAEEKANWPENVKKLLAAYQETVKHA